MSEQPPAPQAARVYLSDLHLEATDDPKFRTFCDLLKVESRLGSEIVILGDLCEVWVGDDDDGELAVALTWVLRQACQHSKVYLMRGNRDFLFGADFGQATGVQLLEDPHPTINGEGVLLSHGDIFCVDDKAYQQARAMFRNPEWQASILSQTLPARRELAASLRAQSQASNANKAANIMDVNLSAVQAALDKYNCQHLIHGHTHRPGIHKDGNQVRYVLGDWDRCGWVLRRPLAGDDVAIDGLSSELRRFALTGRYEI